MKRKIVSIETYDEDPEAIEIELDNRNVIMLTLKSKRSDALFAEVIKERLPPRTDGERVYWHNGASLTLDEIMTILRANNGG